VIALPVVPFIADAGKFNPVDNSPRQSSKVVSVCLFFLPIYATGTVFVRAAWALQSFQIGIFALLGVYPIAGIHRGKEQTAQEWPAFLVYFIPLWDLMQVLAHTTSSTFETRAAVLRWGALAGVFFPIQTVAAIRGVRRGSAYKWSMFGEEG
jgi:hypothetical protein